MSTNDRIERDVYIAADAARVWAVLTQPEHIAAWFGNGEPPEIDLRPGGRIVFDHGDGDDNGKLPATIERVEYEKEFAFRWCTDAGEPRSDADGESDAAGETDTDHESSADHGRDAAVATLVEFILTPEGGGTRLRVIESGFAQVAGDPALIEHRYRANVGGWRKAVRGIAMYVERADEADGEEVLGDLEADLEGYSVSDAEVMEAMEVEVMEPF